MSSRFEPMIEQATVLWVVLLTPAFMLGGFALFLDKAAIRLGILDMADDYVAGLGLALVLLVAMQALPLPRRHVRVLTLLWLVRIGIVLGVMLPYDAIYAADAVLYFRAGQFLNDPWSAFEFGNGTVNIIATVGLMSAVAETYSGLKVLFSFLGLGAVYLFYRATVLFLGREMIGILYLLGIFPSILFWSSILGKDPVVLLGIALFCYGVAGLLTHRGRWSLLAVVLGLLLAASIRQWLSVILLVPLIATYVMSGRTSLVVKIGFLIVAVPAFLVAVQGFAAQFSIETAEDLVQRTDKIAHAWAAGGSAQQIEGSFSSVWSMIAFMPVGGFTALFRPLPGEVLNPFGMIAGLENALVLALILAGLYRRGLGWRHEPMLLWAVLTVLIWASVYGFASYQNLGSAFRFRVQVAPLMVLFGLYLNFGHLLADAEAPPAVADGGEAGEAEPDTA